MNSRLLVPYLVPAALVCASAFATHAAYAAESFHYSLASQQEYGARRGFRLGFEDNTSEIPRKRENLSLTLGVADGKTWHYLSFKTNWQWDHDYQIKADIGPKSTTLWVDGQPVKQVACGFVAAESLDALKAGLDTRHDMGASEYLVHQENLRLSTSKNQTQRFAFPTPEARPIALFALDPQSPVNTPWKMTNGETITVETTFRLRHSPNVKTLSPFVDRYGQSVHAEWVGKIHNEAEFKQAAQDEKKRNAAWGKPTGYDTYGGWTQAGWTEKPTGFFRTVRRNGVWWLVSPNGNPCFYLGVDTVTGTSERTGITNREYLFDGLPPESGAMAPAWVTGEDGSKSFGFTTANLIRKYGENWENAAWQEAGNRLRVWGFSGVGKWSGIPKQIQAPAFQVLRRTDVPKLGRLPDIFDPSVRAVFRAVLEKNITPNKNNPNLVGWSLGNEHDEIVLKTDVEAILKLPGTVPAKHALTDYALQHIYKADVNKMASAWQIPLQSNGTVTVQRLEATDVKPPASDMEAMRLHYAETYYDFVYRNVKEIDPNHLCMGFWIAIGWWENEDDWRVMARHCDVIGYDDYRFQFSDARFDRLMKEADKPVLCGEFSYPSWYNGSRGYGVYGTATASDAESGKRYADLVTSAAQNPYCVGMLWFQYRDQPLTGRGAKGSGLVLDEHFAFGLVDITDRPKWDMIGPMREANIAAPRLRQQRTKSGGK